MPSPTQSPDPGRPACLVSNERTGLGSGSLQDAINTAARGDTLTVEGTCLGPGAWVGRNANFVIDRDLTIRGIANEELGAPTLDGGLKGPVVEVLSGLTVTLIGLTITNGFLLNSPIGGLSNEGNLALIDSTVTGNRANTGGGIENGFRGSMTITNSTVSGNTSRAGGGGIYNAGTMTIADSTVSANTSELLAGGGIWNSGVLYVTNSTIHGNRAAQGGGGIYNQGSQYGLGVLSVIDSTVRDNTAANGGGIYNLGTGEITDSYVSDNTAVQVGGFSGHGGGIVNVRGYLAEPPNLTVANSIISGNAATAGSGGGILNGLSSGEASFLTLTDSTVSSNSAAYGGGIWNVGTFTIQGSVVSLNVTQYLGGGILSLGALTFNSAPTTIGGNTGTVSWGGIANDGGTVSGGCPTVLGQGAPPSTTTTGLVVYDPPNLAGQEFDSDYAGFTC
jgi:hypothetical protein